MRGITESDLLMHRNNDRLDWDTRRAFDIVMRICPPKELNPWLPIADAPKNETVVILYFPDKPPCAAFWSYVSRDWHLFAAYRDTTPTHYQELPEYPE